MNLKNLMWTEKYRPRVVDDIVGDHKEKIKKYLEDPMSMQHLLFYSVSPGTGKTTTAKVIINTLGWDTLMLNSSEDRKIETVRAKIISFAQTKTTQPNTRRIIFLDEADGLTPAAQDALRNVMETYAGNALFILTCNNITKVINPLRSRTVGFQLAFPSEHKIRQYLQKIIDAEQVSISDEDLSQLIKAHYPNIRNMVQELQLIKLSGKTDVKRSSLNIFEQVWDYIKQSNWSKVRDIVLRNTDLNIRELNNYVWTKAVAESNTKLIKLTALNEDKMSRGADETIVFVSSLVDLMKKF